MTTSIGNLVQATRERSLAGASSWTGRLTEKGSVIIRHYSTDMLLVYGDDSVEALDPGWASVTDRQGIGKILSNLRCEESTYRDLWSDEYLIQVGLKQPRKSRAKPKPDTYELPTKQEIIRESIVPFTPPIPATAAYM